MKEKLKSKRVILIMAIIFLLLGIGIISISFIFLKKEPTNEISPSSKEDPILVEERIRGEEEVINILQKYVSSVADFPAYAKNNNLREISLENFSKQFKVDTNEFDNLKYECKKETTMIIFDDKFNKYFFAFDCKKFYLE